MIVRDQTGVRKRILRTEGETVIWEYEDGARSPEQPGEQSSPFSEFADTHFVVPQPRRTSSPGAQRGGEEAGPPAENIQKDTIYVDDQGKRVRVMEVGQKMVQWIEVDDNSGGVTPASEFLKNYHPEGKAA